MLNPTQAKEIINLIESDEIKTAFSKLKEYHIETLQITRFQKEYVFGNLQFDFYERFATYINTIAHTNHTVAPPNFDIFFSFSSKNQSAAQQEVQKLRNAGLKVFFSGEDLSQHIGEEFLDKIQHALNYTKHFVLYCTPQAMQSRWVKLEYSTFFTQFHMNDEKRRLFILRGENFNNDLVPLFMRSIQTGTTEQVIHVLNPTTSRKETQVASKQNYTVPKIQTFPNGIKLIKVEGGSFMMGSNDYSNTKPHKVTLTDYYIGETEVTNAQYAAFLNEYGSDEVKEGEYKGQKMIYESQTEYSGKYNWGLKKENGTWKPQTGYENHPVIYVNWFGANEFCTYYKGFLPSEAQWEYAARGGNKSKNYNYAGSNELNDVAWNRSNSYAKGSDSKDYGTHTVKTKNPNELGLYDMSGNVFEWCQDWYDEKYYENNKIITNPINNIKADYVVMRGGSWFDFSANCLVAYRGRYGTTNRYNVMGFRICSPSI
jgi:formylglycine-generating enzyme required for sulfatase activity